MVLHFLWLNQHDVAVQCNLPETGQLGREEYHLCIVQFLRKLMPLMYINNRGPKTEPSGTPDRIVSDWDETPLSTTDCALPVW